MGDGSALRELLAIFDIKIDDGNLRKAQTAIEGIKAQLSNFGTVVAGAFAVREITQFVESTIDMGREIAGSARLLGVTTDQFQMLSGAAQLSGLSAEDVTTGFKFLNKNMGEAIMKGGDSAALFQKLGIQLKDTNGHARDSFEVFNDVADAIAKIPDPMQRTYVATELMSRGGARMTKMLAGGSAGLKDLYKQVDEAGGIIDSGFIKESVEAGHEMEKWKMSIRALKVALVSDFLPYIDQAIKYARDAVRWFSDLAKHTTTLQSAAIALSVLGIAKVTASLGSLFKSLGMLSSFSTGEGILAKLFSMGEVGLIIAAIVALYLVFDDLYALFTGNESLIGDTLADLLGYKEATKIFTDLKKSWQQLGDALDISNVNLADGLKLVNDIILAITILVHWWTIVADAVVIVINWVTFLVKELLDVGGIIGGLMSGDTDEIKKWSSEAAKDFGEMIDKTGDRLSNIFQEGSNAVEVGSQLSIPSGGGKTEMNNNNHFTFNITGDDADAIGEKVKKTIDNQMPYWFPDFPQQVYAAGASRVK